MVGWQKASRDLKFQHTEDQTMLRAMAQRYVAEHGGIDKLRSGRNESIGFSQEGWCKLAELGILAALLPTGSADDTRAAGGLGPVELTIIFQELGRGLATAPVADAILGAGGAFMAGAEASLQEQWTDDLASGKRRLALAITERETRYNSTRATARIVRNGSGPHISGDKIAVAHAVGADGFIVSAAPSDGLPQLFLIDAQAGGVTLVPYRQIDGSVAATLLLRDVIPLAQLSGGSATIRAAEARLWLAHAAEAVGIMDLLLDATLEYLCQRQQFGKAIGSFQAIQHRMAAQYVALEQARSLLYWVTMLGAKEGEERLRAIAGVRSFILEAAIGLGHEAIQMHGGMGVTDELSIGHAHKRLLQIARSSEPPDLGLDRYAGLAPTRGKSERL